MPQWNPSKHPSVWPLAWHEAIRGPEGEVTLASDFDSQELHKLRKKFLVFKACMRRYPDHPTSRIAAGLSLWLSVEPFLDRYALMLRKQPRLTIPGEDITREA